MRSRVLFFGLLAFIFSSYRVKAAEDVPVSGKLSWQAPSGEGKDFVVKGYRLSYAILAPDTPCNSVTKLPYFVDVGPATDWNLAADPNFQPGLKYYFKIQSYNDKGESSPYEQGACVIIAGSPEMDNGPRAVPSSAAAGNYAITPPVATAGSPDATMMATAKGAADHPADASTKLAAAANASGVAGGADTSRVAPAPTTDNGVQMQKLNPPSNASENAGASAAANDRKASPPAAAGRRRASDVAALAPVAQQEAGREAFVGKLTEKPVLILVGLLSLVLIYRRTKKTP